MTASLGLSPMISKMFIYVPMDNHVFFPIVFFTYLVCHVFHFQDILDWEVLLTFTDVLNLFLSSILQYKLQSIQQLSWSLKSIQQLSWSEIQQPVMDAFHFTHVTTVLNTHCTDYKLLSGCNSICCLSYIKLLIMSGYLQDHMFQLFLTIWWIP